VWCPEAGFLVWLRYVPCSTKVRNNDLNNINWNVILNDNDVNSSFEKCWDIFNTLYDLHFPLKNVKINKNVHKINNFMTKGLLVSRKNKML
jgi:hypothetical protein